MTSSTFDFVVVGGGAAGCVIAARLSEHTDASVLLLEAGGDERRPDVQTPEAWPTLLGSDADWASETVIQDELDRTVPAPRGRILGGSGSINVMAHLRGHRSDYDRWAELGAEGWDWAGVLPFHKATEHVPDGDPTVRGRGGPLRPRPISDPHPLSVAHVAAAQAAGFPVAVDLNDGELRGVALHDLLIDAEHRRQSAATAYLRPAASRETLTIVTGSEVTRLIVEHGRCRGVEYVADGQSEVAFAARETVLTAGTVGTTRLLLLSGIGPARELENLGIDPVADAPEVGHNLQDHVLLAGIRVRTEEPVAAPTGNFAEATLFTTRDGMPGRPDMQICNVQVDYFTAAQAPARQAFTMGVGLMRPASRGSLRLVSADPSDPVRIDPRYLSEQSDRDAAISGIEVAARLATTGAFDQWGGRCDAVDWLRRDAGDLDRLVSDAVSSYFHLCGTARMGSDDGAVVDPRLRVRGVESLRVADASVMPEIVSSNTHPAVLMIGEKAAAMMLEV